MERPPSASIKKHKNKFVTLYVERGPSFGMKYVGREDNLRRNFEIRIGKTDKWQEFKIIQCNISGQSPLNKHNGVTIHNEKEATTWLLREPWG